MHKNGADMIELAHLTRRFGAFTAVDGLAFTVARGEVLGFLGPNGAGKTTSMRMLAGSLAPTSGAARICGFDVVTQPLQAKSKLGYLPEGAPAWPDMTVAELLSFIAALRGLRGEEASRGISRAVARANLQTALGRMISTLSKGFRRRVGLAQALLHDPDVLVLDEPTDGLDPNQKHDVRGMIREMAPDKAIIISTHILEEVEALCSRVVVIHHGRIVADETPEELIARDADHNGVRLSLAADAAAQAAIRLRAAAGVAEVREEGEGVLFVRPTPQQARMGGAAPITADILREAGVSPRAFEPVRGRLDVVFRQLTPPVSNGEGRKAAS